MLKHLENHECHNDWTIQHLNALAEECTGSTRCIIPGRGTWFRAGAPPLKPKKADRDPYDGFFICSICRMGYERESQLKEHLNDRECSHDYPSVLQCPLCPGTGFERLSELFEHLEHRGCWHEDRRLANMVQSLERKFEDPGVQKRLDKESYRLKADESRRGKLYVRTRLLDDDEVRWRPHRERR